MRERPVRRAVHSAALLETVELRRLLSVAPDASFGTGGVVHFDDLLVPPAQYDQIVTAQNAAGITTVAEISDANTSGLENQLLVRRFSTTGAELSNSTVSLPFSSIDNLTITDVAVDAANNAYVAGSRFDVSANATVGFVVKIGPSNTYDPTFAGGTGSIETAGLAFNSQNVQLAVSGGTVYATYVTEDLLDPSVRIANTLALDTSGVPDIGYGVAGTASNVLPQVGGTVNEVLLDGSGLLLVGTLADNASVQSLYVGRLNGTGTPDLGFGANGFGVTDPTGFELNVSGVTRVSTGYVVAGTAVTSEQVVVKIASDLTLDETFDADGVVVLGAPIFLSPLDRSTRTITSDADGNIYATGITFGDDSADLAVLRLDPTGALDLSFDADGLFVLDEAEADIGIGLTTTPSGAILVAGSQIDGLTGAQTGLLLQLAEEPVVSEPFEIVSGQLVLTDNAGNDTVVLSASGAGYLLTVNGVDYSISGLTSVSLAGGAGADDIRITTPLGIPILLDGGDGADFLFISSSVTTPTTLIGGAGNDTLRGGSGNDIVTGDDGNDLIIGRDGNDLMIGGTGADFLIGREDADILISGISTLSSNLPALAAIMAEWTSNHSVLVKLANITGLLPLPGRLNGNNYLTPGVTVFADNSSDTLSGGDGADLYYITLFGLNRDILRDGLNSFPPDIASLVFGG